jgi:hypothetical protein
MFRTWILAIGTLFVDAVWSILEVCFGTYNGVEVQKLVLHTALAVSIAVAIAVTNNCLRIFGTEKVKGLYSVTDKKFYFVKSNVNIKDIPEVPLGLRVTLPLACSGIADLLYPLQ